MNYKLKIIIGAIGAAVVAVVLFMFIYPMFGRSNDALALQLEERKKEYENLNSEKRSIEQGQKDLDTISRRVTQPQDLFSSDQTLVEEVRTLESIAEFHNLELELDVSGTVAEAVPVPNTNSGLISITYAIELEGSYNSLVEFLDAFEQLPFVSHISEMKVQSVIAENQVQGVRAQLTAEFFIKYEER